MGTLSLRRTRRCSASRRKRAIEINGIKGFIGEKERRKGGKKEYQRLVVD